MWNNEIIIAVTGSKNYLEFNVRRTWYSHIHPSLLGKLLVLPEWKPSQFVSQSESSEACEGQWNLYKSPWSAINWWHSLTEVCPLTTVYVPTIVHSYIFSRCLGLQTKASTWMLTITWSTPKVWLNSLHLFLHFCECPGASHLDGVDKETLEVVNEHWGKFPPQHPLINHVVGICFFFLWAVNFFGNGSVCYIFLKVNTQHCWHWMLTMSSLT